MSVILTIGARDIDGPAGRLELLIDEPQRAAGTNTPAEPSAIAVVGHPHPKHGGTMHSKVVYHMAQGLSRVGCAVVRFNFRGVGRSVGAFDDGVGEADDFRAVLDYAAKQYPGVGLYAAGYSFGGWIALSVGASDPRVQLLLAVAPPVRQDLPETDGQRKPTFLIHGERDEVVPLKDMRRFYASLHEPRELVVIDGADHLFDGKTSEVGDAVADLLEGLEP